MDWQRYGHRHLAQAMDDLDLDAMPLPPSGSGYSPALLYRRETMGRWKYWNTDFSDQTVHGFGVAAFDVGLPVPLAVVSAHVNPFAAGKGRDDASLIVSRAYRYGPYAIVGGDINYPPAHRSSPVPDYAAMRPYNRSARTRLPSEAGGQVIPERRIAETLDHGGFIDVAWKLYQESGDTRLLRRTATDDRVDQVWVSTPLSECIVDYRVLDEPEGASDHLGLLVRLDLGRADTSNAWAYR